MRDLKDCRAEVFRRSAERIYARKQRRKHLLMVCVPLVLCASLLALPQLLPEERMGEIAENQYSMQHDAPGAAGGIIVHEGLAVNVSGNGISHCYTSDEKVGALICLIDDIVNTAEDVQSGFTAQDRVDGTSGLKQNYRGKGYQILIRHGDGTESEYLLMGSVLLDQRTEACFYMDEETLFALKEALGIPCY